MKRRGKEGGVYLGVMMYLVKEVACHGPLSSIVSWFCIVAMCVVVT